MENDWDPVAEPKTPQMLDALEEAVCKIEMTRWLDILMPLSPEGQAGFIENMRTELPELDPLAAMLLEPHGYDVQKFDTDAWRARIEKARGLLCQFPG